MIPPSRPTQSIASVKKCQSSRLVDSAWNKEREWVEEAKNRQQRESDNAPFATIGAAEAGG